MRLVRVPVVHTRQRIDIAQIENVLCAEILTEFVPHLQEGKDGWDIRTQTNLLISLCHIVVDSDSPTRIHCSRCAHNCPNQGVVHAFIALEIFSSTFL